MATTLQSAGAARALEKEAIAPLALAIPAAFTALGLYGAQGDIREGIRRKSIGQTAWGAAQVPLAFVGMGATGAAGKWAPKILKAAPWARHIPGAKAISGVERGLTWGGSKALSPFYRGARALGAAPGNSRRLIGLRKTKWLTDRFGRKALAPTAGLLGAYHLGSQFSNDGSDGGGPVSEQGGVPVTAGQRGMQMVHDYAPQARMMGLPVVGALS